MIMCFGQETPDAMARAAASRDAAPIAAAPRDAPLVAAESGAVETAIRRSIWPGVATGIIVYIATRLIDRWFFGGNRR